MDRPVEHLLVLPLPFQRREGRLLVESQAANGLRLWAEHFRTMAVAAPVVGPDHDLARVHAWMPVEDHPCRERLQFIALEDDGNRIAAAGRARELIGRSEYLQFALGGGRRDWGCLFAEIAASMGRSYAVHLDRVEHEVLRRGRGRWGALSRVKLRLDSTRIRRRHGDIIRLASLLLCHGNDVYEAFRHDCPGARLIHNVHTSADEVATEERIREKAAAIPGRDTLNVCYAGRMEQEKAPQQWLRAIAAARRSGADVRGTWLGDGSLADDAQRLIAELNLAGAVDLPGFVADRDRVLATIRSADAMLFTHLVPESPRCLLEALICATPIIGYDSAFQRDLIHEHGGGLLVKTGDWNALGGALADLARDRARLADMVRRAGRDGKAFTGDRVFAHRAALLKQMLPGGGRCAS